MKAVTTFFSHRNSAKALSGLLFLGAALHLESVVASADQASAECERAEMACSSYLETAGTKECEEDYECDAYFYDCSAGCDQPTILRRPGVSKDQESGLRQLVTAVRKSCGVEATAPERCRPELPITACIAGRCEIVPETAVPDEDPPAAPADPTPVSEAK